MAKQQRRTTKPAAPRKNTTVLSRRKAGSATGARSVKRASPANRAGKSSPTKSGRGASAIRSKARLRPSAKAGAPVGRSDEIGAKTVNQPAAAQAAAPAPPRKPGFYEAVAIYERGVQALQRHDFRAAAEQFRVVLDRYPEERELLERARLYLRVCERETERQPQGPRTPEERVYAATVALNSGDHAGALEHLQRALTEDAESDHAHYTMAVALGMRGRLDEAIEHLRQAIGLNQENRVLARQDPDLEAVRGHHAFRAALDTPAMPRRRTRPRR
jgi:tetratricopeptide (TPR) repeat protein